MVRKSIPPGIIAELEVKELSISSCIRANFLIASCGLLIALLTIFLKSFIASQISILELPLVCCPFNFLTISISSFNNISLLSALSIRRNSPPNINIACLPNIFLSKCIITSEKLSFIWSRTFTEEKPIADSDGETCSGAICWLISAELAPPTASFNMLNLRATTSSKYEELSHHQE